MHVLCVYVYVRVHVSACVCSVYIRICTHVRLYVYVYVCIYNYVTHINWLLDQAPLHPLCSATELLVKVSIVLYCKIYNKITSATIKGMVFNHVHEHGA